MIGEEVVVGFSDGSISGLDPVGGVERWREQIGEGKFPDIQAEVLAGDGQFFAAAFGGPLIAFDARSRAKNWTNDQAGATSRIVSAGGLLFMTAVQGELLAINASTGKKEWAWSAGEVQLGTPTVHGSTILVGAVGGTLYAIDRFEGKEVWKYEPADGTKMAGITAAPAVEGRQALFTTAGGRVVSLTADRVDAYDPDELPAERKTRAFGW